MTALYHSLFTEKGLELLRESIQNGTKLGITHMSFGDGGGVLPVPDASFTQMVNEVYRVQLNRLAPSKENPNWLEADGVIPTAIGGFNIREVGLWAGTVMVAYANYPPTYKPSGDQGTAQIKTIRIVLQIDNTANFELKIDASIVMATIESVNEKIEAEKQNLVFLRKDVQTMIQDISLKNGNYVKTIGYHSSGDDGGALYLISNEPIDYAIPLDNGLYAVFNDTFDIRKFGLVSSATLDQSVLIDRMIKYADSRIYEIDFLGFNILNPEIYQCTTSRGSVVKSMGFNYVHKLKNLFIFNNKNKQLVQGTCCITFLPKSDGTGTFDFENVKCDPYVADYKLNYTETAGEYDGMMLGFLADKHPDWAGFDRSVMTGYSFKLDDIDFISPAVSYNISTAGLFAPKIEMNHLRGEYWGIYVHYFANEVYANDCDAVLRDDLDLKTRVLVRNMLHEEPEIGNATVSQKLQSFSNLKAVRKTNGTFATCVKHHSVGNHNFSEIRFDRIQGRVEYYAAPGKTTNAKKITIDNSLTDLTVSFFLTVNELIFNKSTVVNPFLYTSNKYQLKKIYAYDSTIGNILQTSEAYEPVIELVRLERCTVNNETYGLMRGSAHVNKFEFKDLTLQSSRLIECSFDLVEMDGLNIASAVNGYGNIFYLKHLTASSAIIKAKNVDSKISKQSATYFAMAQAGQTVNVDLSFAKFLERPAFSNASVSELFVSPIPAWSKVYDFPSLAAGGIQSTTISTPGLNIGDAVTVSFNQPLQGSRIWAEVTANNVVTVYQQNPTGAAVDLVSGTLTVRRA